MKRDLIYFNCSCESLDHLLVAELDSHESDVIVSFLMKKPSLSWRIKHVFGLSQYGLFGDTILTSEHLPGLKRIIKHLEGEKDLPPVEQSRANSAA